MDETQSMRKDKLFSKLPEWKLKSIVSEYPLCLVLVVYWYAIIL